MQRDPCSDDDFLLLVQPIAVNDRVGDDFADGKPHLLQFIAPKTCSLRELEDDILRGIDILESRIQHLDCSFQRFYPVSCYHVGLFRERGGYVSGLVSAFSRLGDAIRF
jgi:hypothetical protein